jgi:hypothetical protein
VRLYDQVEAHAVPAVEAPGQQDEQQLQHAQAQEEAGVVVEAALVKETPV